MKILRMTFFNPADIHHPITLGLVHVREPMEEAAREVVERGTFAIIDVFEAPDDTEHPELLAARRVQDSVRFEEECNMAISYYWNASHLKITREGGVICNPKPAPLSVEQVKEVQRQLKLHPDYKGQKFLMFARDDNHMVAG
jgi:hypothetical protein